MRYLLSLALTIALVGSATAADLGNERRVLKNNDHIGMNPGTPDGRQGGEDIASAFVFNTLPFADTGNTAANFDDYDAECPYVGSTSPDVVYSYTPTTEITVSVDLLGSTYDTKTYIYDSGMNVIACNDDFYSDYVSFIAEATLMGGETYFFVIDGYGGDGGDYILAIDEFYSPPPCIIECDGYDENEPALVDGYLDAHNGGCNSPEFGSPFTDLDFWPCGHFGDLTLCGNAGWYITADGGNSRDTDWISILVGETGVIQWTLDAEQETSGFLLGPNDCDTVSVIDSMVAGPCSPQTMTIQSQPLEILWVWVGASTFEAPPGFEGHEYNYQCDFVGLYNSAGATPTDKITFDGIKSLYR